MADDLLAALGDCGLGALTTIKRDGRPQLSMVSYQHVPADRLVRVSVTEDRAKVKNLRRDPRVSMLVQPPGSGGYVVAEGVARLGAVAQAVDDAVTDELVAHFRVVNGEHEDWADFRRAMVRDRRLLLTFVVDHVYGWV